MSRPQEPVSGAGADERGADGLGRLLAVADSVIDRTEVPGTLLPAVMGTVWSELHRGTAIPLPSAAGSATVADYAVAAVLHRALARSSGLRIRACEVEPGSVPGSIAVRLDTAVRYGSDLERATRQVRAAVHSAAHTHFGLLADVVDIAVVDVTTEKEESV